MVEGAGPFNRLAEMAVIGGLVEHGDSQELAWQVVEEKGLSEEEFYFDVHRAIFKVMLRMRADGKVIDLVNVVAELSRRPEGMAIPHSIRLDVAGYIDECIMSCPSQENIGYYIDEVRDCAERRRLIRLGVKLEEVIEKVRDMSVDVEAVWSELGNLVGDRGREGQVGRQGEIVHRGPKVVGWEELNAIPIDQGVSGYVIEDWLRRGEVGMLAGRPKIGKSWMALEMGLSVASGRAWMNSEVEKGSVLYVALEDTAERIARRKKALVGDEVIEKFYVGLGFYNMESGGLKEIMKWISAIDEPRLVVIDTFQMFRAPLQKYENVYQADYEAISAIKRMAMAGNVGVLLVHHLRKMQAGISGQGSNDIVERVLGSTGITGAIDMLMVLDKGRMVKQGYLMRTGRDVIEGMYAVEFGEEGGLMSWKLLGDAELFDEVSVSEEIITAMAKMNAPLGPREVSDLTGVGYETVRQLMVRLCSKGKLIRVGRGTYIVNPKENY